MQVLYTSTFLVPLENPIQFALKVCHCNISLCKMLITYYDHIIAILVKIFYASKLWKHSSTQQHFRGKLPCMTTTRCLVKKPGGINVTSYWHMLNRFQDFLEVGIEQSLTRFTKHAKVVFPTASDGKGLAAGQKELRTAQKKGRVFGEFGSFWGWQA